MRQAGFPAVAVAAALVGAGLFAAPAARAIDHLETGDAGDVVLTTDGATTPGGALAAVVGGRGGVYDPHLFPFDGLGSPFARDGGIAAATAGTRASGVTFTPGGSGTYFPALTAGNDDPLPFGPGGTLSAWSGARPGAAAAYPASASADAKVNGDSVPEPGALAFALVTAGGLIFMGARARSAGAEPGSTIRPDDFGDSE